jgi:hypothetical protein
MTTNRFSLFAALITLLNLFLVFSPSQTVLAQGKKKQVADTKALVEKKQRDAEAIKAMCGCYEVEFAFAETFAADSTYEFKPNYRSGALEWVELVEDADGKIVLQHLLIIGDSAIVKHWRQDWLYENTAFYQFEKDNTWRFQTLNKEQVAGQWTQRVFQVDDSPRYEGSATWVHVDGRSYWENTADSPLPRREFTTRSDYNVMKRRNRHEITDYGWVHEQDNDKILRQTANVKTAYQDTWIATEKGFNPCRRVENSRCALAQKWWTENGSFWAAVRAEWETILQRQTDLMMEKSVDEKPLFMHMKPLEKEKNTKGIMPLLDKFIRKD